MRRRLIMMCVMAWPLGGCASFSSGPSTCDGLARRPLNRSLWDWEGATLASPRALAAIPSGRIYTARAGNSSANIAPNRALSASSMASDKTNATGGAELASYRSCGKES
jgi:type IV secretion system protein VirB7